ncbi:hypothetical protein [Microseira wollei]|uniref:Uncharacterized protein n=1 Tax=Microseira wollei NIES-4236 TaxID=2530354 RepID=A0AAV3XTU4_9CYAN|nr:hypothetical protein [Microseira wollei]GET44482.1 hypothetical protein MiSe_93110 [Microseira wollei NIES-4236]
MRFKQHLGIVGAICSSLLVSYGAIAQTTNPTPGGTNPADMQRICAEYMNANGNQAQQSNRTGTTTGNTATGTTGTTTNRNTTNRTGTTTGNTATGTTGTTTNRNTTNRTGTTTGNTASGTTGTTTNRNTTNRTGSTTGNTASGTTATTTGTGQGVGSFTAEELDRMCANLINNSGSGSTTPSVTGGGSTRPSQPSNTPNRR